MPFSWETDLPEAAGATGGFLKTLKRLDLGGFMPPEMQGGYPQLAGTAPTPIPNPAPPMPWETAGAIDVPFLPPANLPPPMPGPQPPHEVSPPGIPQGYQPPPALPTIPRAQEEPGLLSTLGDILDRPGNALRGTLAGDPRALLGLIPFSETLGIFGGPEQVGRVSGQELLKRWGLIDEVNPSILSGAGAAGFGTEMLLDPLNLVFGLGALTKGGKAAKLVGSGISATEKLLEAAKAGSALSDLERLGLKGGAEGLTKLLEAEKAGMSAAEITRAAAEPGSKVAQAFDYLKANNMPMELGQDWATAANQGQRAMLGVGGEWAPIPFMRPLAEFPEKTLIGAPGVAGLAKAGQYAKDLPVVKQLGQLFSHTPPGLEGDAAKAMQEEIDAAGRKLSSGLSRAEEEAALFDQALKQPQLLNDVRAEGAGRELISPPLADKPLLPPELQGLGTETAKPPIDVHTGEVLGDLAGTPEEQILAMADEVGAANAKARELSDELNRAKSELQAANTLQQTFGEQPLPPELVGTKTMSLTEMALRPAEGKAANFVPPGMRNRVTGKVLSVNPNDTVTLEYKGQQYVVEANKVHPTAKQANALEAGKVRADLKAQYGDELPALEKRAADTRAAYREIFGPEIDAIAPQGYDPGGFNQKLQGKRDAELQALGLSGDVGGQSKALPKALEKMLGAPQILENGPPELKSIEYLSADAAELMPGDSFTLAGEKVKVLPSDVPGKVKLKDGFTIEVPDSYVPKDRGAEIVRRTVAAQEEAQKAIKAGDQVSALTLGPGTYKVVGAGGDTLTLKGPDGVLHKVPRSSALPAEKAAGKIAASMAPEEARNVLAGLEEHAAATAMPETAGFLETLGREAKAPPLASPFSITPKVKAGLEALGWEAEDIAKMDPVEALKTLGDGRAKKVADMSVEQLQRALLTSEKVGLPNARAYAEAPKLPVQVHSDVDSLKWVNDNISHEAGDQLLQAVGKALKEEGIEAYHISGDEFFAQFRTAEEAKAAMEAATQRLQNATLEFTTSDGVKYTYQGGFSYGLGPEGTSAEAALQQHKLQREAAGARAARGERPPGLSGGPPAQGRQLEGRNVAGNPAAPRAAEAAGVGPPELQATQSTAASVPFTVTKQTRQQLYDLGLSRAEVDAMTPEQALARLKQAEMPARPARGLEDLPEPLRPKREPGRDKGVIAKDLRFTRQLRDEAQKALDSLPPDMIEGPEWQKLSHEIARHNNKIFALTREAETGLKPVLGYEPTYAAAQRLRYAQEFDSAVKADNAIKGYLQKAGFGTAEAAKKAAKMLPDEAAPEVHRAITDAVELAAERGGKAAAGKVGEIATAMQERYAQMHAAEQAMSVPTAALKDPRLSYTTRTSTKYGTGWFRSIASDAKKRGALFVALEDARKAKGLEPAGLAAALENKIGQAVRNPEAAKTAGIPYLKRGWGADRFERLDDATKAFIEKNGLKEEFLAFELAASNIHPSQIQRLPAFQGLTVNELNEVFRKSGAKGEVFNSNPAAQLFARSARHARAAAADQLFKQLDRRLGVEMPEGTVTKAFHDSPGIEVVTKNGQPVGYGVAEFNEVLSNQNKRGVFFPDLATAEAAQKSLAKILKPKEAEGLLRYYDQVTQMAKAWVTKAFPAYHMRNRASNRIQSWFDDVPVAGEHYKQAQRAMAGAEASVTLGDGSKLNREQILREAVDDGVVKGGFYEYEFGKRAKFERGANKASLNPLDPNNALIRTGEKIGAGLAQAPGRLLSGAGLKDIGKLDASMVENTDRLGHYLYKRMEGFSRAEAAQSVKKALFDYGEMNDFEREILGRAVFFYQWQRNAIPLVLETMLHKPAKIRQLTQISGGAGNRPEGGPEILPSWVKEGLPVNFGKDESGNDLMAYGFGTPIEGALEPFAGFAGGFQEGAEKLLSQANPIARIPLELATGRRFFLHKNIEDAKKAPAWMGDLPPELQAAAGIREVKDKEGNIKRWEGPPELIYAIDNSPFGRVSATAGKAADSRKTAVSRLLNILTGGKIVSIDPEQEKYYAQKDAIKAKLKEMERQGLVMSPEIFAATAAGKEEAPDEIKALLKGLRAKK